MNFSSITTKIQELGHAMFAQEGRWQVWFSRIRLEINSYVKHLHIGQGHNLKF